MSRRRNRSELLDGGGDYVEVIEYGVRRSRRAISNEYRDSSSLTPAQFMEQEVYSASAEDILHRSIAIANIIAILFILHNHYIRSIATSYWISNELKDAIRAKMKRIKCQIDRLISLMSWVVSYGEMALLYAEDLTIFIRPRNRFKPERFRRLDEISRGDCDAWFGISPFRLRQLFIHWRIPPTFTSSSRHVYAGEEAFIIFLYHIEQGEPFTKMARDKFGGDPRSFSKMSDAMIDYLYYTFYNKISGTSLDQWLPRYLDDCRLLIHNALTRNVGVLETEFVNGEVVNETWIHHHFHFPTFRPFGFLDDFALRTPRPGVSLRRQYRFRDDIQRAFYSGYLRGHGLKAQVVWLPIGIIGSVYITEIRQNDNGVQNMSGLNNYLARIFSGILIGGLFPCLYCDGIFALLVTILPRFVNPTPEQYILNMRLASLRQSIEHVFGDHWTRFKLFQVPQHYLRLVGRGEKVRRMSLVSFFILNCYYCMNGHRSRYFGRIPPTLNEYIPLDEILVPPPAVNLGDVWDYGPPHNV